MNEQTNAPMLPPPSGVAEWFSVWRDAVTRPSEQTFSRIALSPNAKLTTAFLWVFLGSLVNIFVTSLLPNPFMQEMMQNSGFGQGFPRGAGGGLLAAICGAPIGAVISVIIFAVVVGVVQLLAQMFGGRGTYDRLAYTIAAIVVPFNLIGTLLTLLGAIPVPFLGLCFGLIGLAVALYVFVLQVMAVKTVNQFGWVQAAASLLLPVLVVLCCALVGAFAIARLIAENMPGGFPFPTPGP